MHAFTSSTLLCISLFILTSHVEGFMRHVRYHEYLRRAPRDFRVHPRLGSVENTGTAAPSGSFGTAVSTSRHNYTFTGRTPYSSTLSASEPSSVSQMSLDQQAGQGCQANVIPATVIRSIYEVCELPGGNITTCYPVVETATTSSCSTVLTGFFSRVTVSDCDQSVTFSTRNGFEIITTSGPVAERGIAARQAPTASTYIQSMVSYYVAPWQSIAANSPDDIRVIVCTVDTNEAETCNEVREVWEVHTEIVPTLVTTAVTISRFFSVPAVLHLGQDQDLTVPVGNADITTAITLSTSSLQAITSTSRALSTITETAEAAENENLAPQDSTSTTTTTTTVFWTVFRNLTATYNRAGASAPYPANNITHMSQYVTSLTTSGEDITTTITLTTKRTSTIEVFPAITLTTTTSELP